MKLLFSSLTLALLMPVAAHAAGECDKYRTSYDKTYCMAKIFFESDNELNASYKDLRGLINDTTKQQLKESQLDWIRYRNGACESEGSINVGCNYRVNRSRTEYLRDRVRECKAGTCRNEMVTKKSWD